MGVFDDGGDGSTPCYNMLPIEICRIVPCIVLEYVLAYLSVNG